MKLAVLSGKGGTGKTLLAVNLAAVMDKALYLDCDVEAPNGRLFFKPEVDMVEPVEVLIPQVDQGLCTGCRVCSDFCSFNALAYINGHIKVFEDLCHSCGGCALLCPAGAIIEVPKRVGRIEYGRSDNVSVGTGIMNIGEASGVAIIDGLTAYGDAYDGNVVIDCPPGSACVVMESIKEADYCLVVAEPTVFGLHNMKMVIELAAKMHMAYGVVINKSYGDDARIEEYCQKKGTKILATIKYNVSIGKFGSEGHIAAREDVAFREMFEGIFDRITEEVAYETASCS